MERGQEVSGKTKWTFATKKGASVKEKKDEGSFGAYYVVTIVWVIGRQ